MYIYIYIYIISCIVKDEMFHVKRRNRYNVKNKSLTEVNPATLSLSFS